MNTDRPALRVLHPSSARAARALLQLAITGAWCMTMGSGAAAAELRVSVTDGYAPFESVDVQRHPEGLAVDLVRWIADQRRYLLVY